ncbi:hypothetical protein KKA14_18055, partial [bacterium]|nr:hypothetical protein [bacterium]
MRKRNLKEKVEKVISAGKTKDEVEKPKAKSNKFSQKDIERIIKNLTTKGKSKGFVTDAEIKSIFPGKPTEKVLNALYDFLADKNIEVVDSTKKLSTPKKKIAKAESKPKGGKQPKKSISVKAKAEVAVITPVKAEPAVITPVKAEQAVITPVKAEQAVITPVKAEQAVITPAKVEPAIITPKKTEPIDDIWFEDDLEDDDSIEEISIGTIRTEKGKPQSSQKEKIIKEIIIVEESDDDDDDDSSELESSTISESDVAAKSVVSDQNSDDPVRMYLREMGSIKLLTREGEVEIAKMIEKGQHEMLDILLRSELIINYLFDLGKKLKNGKARARDIVSGIDEDDQVIEEESQSAEQVLEKLQIAKKHFDDRAKYLTKIDATSDVKKLKEYNAELDEARFLLLKTLRSINFNTKQIDAMFGVMLHHNDKVDLTFTQLSRYQRDLRAPVTQVSSLVDDWSENDVEKCEVLEEQIKKLTSHTFRVARRILEKVLAGGRRIDKMITQTD